MPTKRGSGKPPAFQLYTGDWLKDPNLSLCSPATRGIFMDLLCGMHENDRSGKLVGNVEQLSRLARCTPDEMASALAELGETGTADVSDVTFCNGPVTVVNRRMRREWRERKSNAERVKRHRQRSGNVGGEGGVTSKSRSPSSSSSSASAISEASPPAPDEPAHPQRRRMKLVLDLWQDVPEGLHPDPGLVGTWLKGWSDDDALVCNLHDIKARNGFLRGPAFVTSMLRIAWQNGKKPPPPLREPRAASARRAGYNPADGDDLESVVIRSGGRPDA